jgi:exosortase/archaeosortase family protein
LSIATVSTLNAVRDLSGEVRTRWARATTTTHVRVKVGVLILATLFAYHYTLESLLQTVAFDTPLAYIGLVPLIAMALAFALRKPVRHEPPINDRQLDYIIGLPLIAIALCINLLLPSRQSVLFWVRRMDLVSLPFFVAGAVAILFGTRLLWRQKAAILYLFLAWPWPYTTVLQSSLNSFTGFTIGGLTAALKVVHLATPVTAANGETGLFEIPYHGHPFPVSVVSACSGVDGVVGFFLVGAAFTVVVRGPRLRKILWLGLGLVLLWTTNLGRLLLIFWAGKTWGEHAALKVLHPVAGLVIFNIGVLLMILVMKPFGLHFGRTETPPAVDKGTGPPKSPRPTPPVFLATGLVAITGLLLAVNNSSLKSFDLVASASGDAKLSSFLVDPASPRGWAPIYTTEYDQNKSLFGQSSRWFRYNYFYRGGGDLSSTLPVTADVINAAGVRSFGAYGVEACYDFHGYTLRDVARVSLGGGITGETMSFATPANGGWSIVYWIWPVKTGTQTRYERVVLYLLDTNVGQVTPPADVSGIKGLKGALSATNVHDQRLIVNRAFLVAFAREVIAAQAHVTESPTNIGQVTPPAPPAFAQRNVAAQPSSGHRRLLERLRHRHSPLSVPARPAK